MTAWGVFSRVADLAYGHDGQWWRRWRCTPWAVQGLESCSWGLKWASTATFTCAYGELLTTLLLILTMNWQGLGNSRLEAMVHESTTSLSNPCCYLKRATPLQRRRCALGRQRGREVTREKIVGRDRGSEGVEDRPNKQCKRARAYPKRNMLQTSALHPTHATVLLQGLRLCALRSKRSLGQKRGFFDVQAQELLQQRQGPASDDPNSHWHAR